MSARLTESTAESAALGWLESLGWEVKHGPEIAPDGESPERNDFREVVLASRLRDALTRLNPELPQEALEDAFRRLTNPEGATLEARNRAVHRMLVDGVTVEYRRPDGRIAGAQACVLDFDNPENNDWLAVNQFRVTEGRSSRRPDIVLFLNGLPLVIIELKNPADEKATTWAAFNQLQTYKAELPTLFAFNELLVISDGLEARLGTLTAGREWFKPWRTISGVVIEDERVPQLEVLLKGVFNKGNLLALLRNFIVFADDGSGRLDKKVAGYHQFHAVRVAVAETRRAAKGVTQSSGGGAASGRPGDGRIGVVWHTQGSGKSLTMVFYAGCIIADPAMGNPTIVVLTDRNDLDHQLFDVFSRCQDLLRQPPVHAETRAHLRALLSRQSGGIIFTTIQKFLPEPGERNPALSDRRNIVVIADEAHRSQYDFIDGLARHMRDALPHASFIAFTGTPLELEDRNTRQVFGDYIDIYDVQRAVDDHATVPIYYEARLAKLNLPEELKPRIDEEFEEVTESEEVERKERLKTKWAQLEAIVGSQRRLRLVAQDIVQHFEDRLRALDGKGMIVCMSRRICVELYNEIARLRPQWHHQDDDKGMMKVVMTGSASDPSDWQPHIRNKDRREFLAKRFRDPADPFKLVIVRDMWLTGFDCPPLHTMYLDKPMRGHTLMQAIARVNRVFRGKPGGLVVDYLGLAHELKAALATYTASGGRGQAVLDQDEAVRVMQEKYEVCCALFHGFDWSRWKTATPEEQLALLPAAQEHVLAQQKGKERLLEAVDQLSRAFALAVPRAEALRIRDDVGFFQAVRAALIKRAPGDGEPDEELDYAIGQIVSRALAPEGVIDLFQAAGLKKPDISMLSEEFLAQIRAMPQKNLAVEILRKLLQGEIRALRRRNLVRAQSFADLLENAVRRYEDRAIDAVQAVEKLLDLSRQVREEGRRGQQLGLSDGELAFYDILSSSQGPQAVLKDDVLRTMAQELLRRMQENVTVDWTVRESPQAQLRVVVKRLLREYGYPQAHGDEVVSKLLKQAENLPELQLPS